MPGAAHIAAGPAELHSLHLDAVRAFAANRRMSCGLSRLPAEAERRGLMAEPNPGRGTAFGFAMSTSGEGVAYVR